jgi:hypothetical protein
VKNFENSASGPKFSKKYRRKRVPYEALWHQNHIVYHYGSLTKKYLEVREKTHLAKNS